MKSEMTSYLEKIRLTKAAATYVAYAHSLNLFRVTCSKPLVTIKEAELIKFAETRKRLGDSERTVYNRVLHVIIFLKAHGRSLSYLPKAPKRVPEEYSVTQVNSILNAVEGRDRLLLEVFLCAGIRNKELANLERADVDFEASTIRIRAKANWKPKSGDEREVAIPRWLLTKLKDLEHGLLFPNEKGGTNQNLIRVVKRAARKASVSGRVDLHKFRSTMVCQLLRSGETLQNVMQQVGHRNLATTQRYLAVSNREQLQNQSEKAFSIYRGEQ